MKRTKSGSPSRRLDALIDTYTPAVASIARGALARLRRQVPGAIEVALVSGHGRRWTWAIPTYFEAPASASSWRTAGAT